MQTTSAILSNHRWSQVSTNTYANPALGKTLNDIGFRVKNEHVRQNACLSNKQSCEGRG